MFEYREYQEKGIEACLEVLQSKSICREIVVAPTGSGKSLYIAQTVKRLNEPILVLQPSKELLKQNYEKFVNLGGEATLCCASLKSKTIKGEPYTIIDGKDVKCREVSKVTFSTIGTAAGHVEDFIKLGVKKIIIDECHLMTQSGTKKYRGKVTEKQPQLKKLIKKLRIGNICGLTATPIYLKSSMSGACLKMMNRVKWKMFTDIKHVTQIPYIVKKGYWSKLVYVETKTDKRNLSYNSSGSDYTNESLKKFYEKNDLNHKIKEEVKNLLSEGRKSILVFVPTIEEANTLHKLIPNSEVVHSKVTDEYRDFVVSGFKNLKIPVVINVNVLAVGFDHPRLDAIITGRPTSSIAVYYQQCIDKNTEVLTKRGFLKYNEITKNDVAYGYNIDTGEIKDNKIKDIIDRKQYYFEDMISYKTNRLDFRVSSEHDMIFKSVKAKKYMKRQSKEMLNYKYGMHVPVSGFEKSKGVNLTNSELTLLGWFLSDGSLTKGGDIIISQSSESPYIKEIEDCISNCGFEVKYNIIKRKNKKYAVGHNYRICRTQCKHLKEFFDKNISNKLDSITRSQLKIVMDSIIKGNGGNKTTKSFDVKSHMIYMGNNRIYADRLQSLLVRRGFYCKLTDYTEINKNPEWGKVGRASKLIKLTFKDTDKCFVTGSNEKDGKIKNKKPYKRSRLIVETEDKNNELWCLETEMGTIITRRNGKVMIMGNCGRGVRKHKDKKDCKIVDFSGNVEKFGKVEELEFLNLDTYGWGLFNGKGQLLTDYPIRTTRKPTKKSLIESYKNKEKRNQNSKILGGYKDKPTFYFGKYKGKTLDEVLRKDKQYVAWLMDKDDWNWYGRKGEILERAIIEKLKLPIPDKYKNKVKTGNYNTLF